jgi:hypothetical protein
MTTLPSPLPATRLIASILSLAVLSACGGGADSGAGAPTVTAAAMTTVTSAQAPSTAAVRGEVRGLNGSIATVILGNQGDLLRMTQTDKAGKFAFANVPGGSVYVKVNAPGFLTSTAQTLVVGAPSGQPAPLVFSATNTGADIFSFHWDNTTGTQEDSVAHVNAQPVIKNVGDVPPPQTGAAADLLSSYNVVLSDNGVKWNPEYASRLLALLGTLPTRNQDTAYAAPPFRISKWELTDQFIDGDIRIKRSTTGDSVVLSTAAFLYATPRLVTLDGVQGRYFSKRLHNALVRFATQDGNDADAAEHVLAQRYGVTTNISSYEQLTAGTTRERADRFAKFKPAELVTLITAMEEMHDSFHKIDGLKYLVRRAYGARTPGDARIIAQAFPGAGYIEFTDQALQESAAVSPQRLILHEKAHFLWANVFTDAQKNDWIKLGGWSRDPRNATKWTTSKTTQFVSAYGHDVSPDEDMAESLATYIVNSALLQSRAPDKYKFLKDRIFKGDRFVTVVRQDLTFGVFDLHPDYTAPGAVKTLDIKLRKTATGDKEVDARMELFGDGGPFPGARQCVIELMPPSGNVAQRNFLSFMPTRADGTYTDKVNGTVLKGYASLFSRYAEGGYWKLTRGTCTDVVGNTRYLGPYELGNAAIYIDNPPVPVGPPKYEPGSMSIRTTPVIIDGRSFNRVTASWKILPHPVDITQSSAQLSNLDFPGGRYLQNSFQQYDRATRTATVAFDVPDFFRGGRYAVTNIQWFDAAGNKASQDFPDSVTNEQPKSVTIVNPKGDSGAPPELDLNRITVTATAVHPAAPDGETTVRVAFYARDDVAGFRNVSINLLNPQGETVSYYFYVDRTIPGGLLPGGDGTTTPFNGNPKAWQRYEAKVVLPAGSVPGIWGIKSMSLDDNAGAGKSYDFTEILHFVVSAK